jgi:hypothetical protein
MLIRPKEYTEQKGKRETRPTRRGADRENPLVYTCKIGEVNPGPISINGRRVYRPPVHPDNELELVNCAVIIS